MAMFRYRLATLLDQKEAHKQDCEKSLASRRAERRRAIETLEALQGIQHGLEQSVRDLRAAALPEGATGEDWQSRADDVALLQQRVEHAKDDVFSQQLHMEDVEQRVAAAASALQQASREVETLRKHRARSEKQFLAGLAQKEALEQEEIAATLYEQRRRA